MIQSSTCPLQTNKKSARDNVCVITFILYFQVSTYWKQVRSVWSFNQRESITKYRGGGQYGLEEGCDDDEDDWIMEEMKGFNIDVCWEGWNIAFEEEFYWHEND